jgi:uncharacterized membrane protein YtjA (UPF0391 family)
MNADQKTDRAPQAATPQRCGFSFAGSHLPAALSYNPIPRPPTNPPRPSDYRSSQVFRSPAAPTQRTTTMLKYAIIFALISLVAGALGFSGVAAGTAGIAKVLFFIFLVVAVVFVVLAVLGVGAARKALK